MPLVKVTTSLSPETKEAADELVLRLSTLTSRLLGKPERWVMTALDAPARLAFGGKLEPACYVEVKNIGRFSPEQTAQLSAELCDELNRSLGVPTNRIYIEFSDAVGHLWGHDRTTFG